MSRKRASESQFNSETHNKKIHKTSSEAGGGVSDIIIDDDDDEGQVEFCTSFSSKEELARTFEHAVKVAVKSVMSEMTKLVDSKYLVFQVRMDGKEKDIESLKLRIEKAEDELKTIRECMNADKDMSSRPLVNTSRLSAKEKVNTLETRVSALSRKLKEPSAMNSIAPFQKQYSVHHVHSAAVSVHKKVQSAQVLMHPDKAAANSNLFTRVRDCVQIANLRIRHEGEGERSLKGAGMKTIELDRVKDATVETLHNKEKCAEIPKEVTEQTRDSRKRKTFVDPVEGGTVGTSPARIPKEVTKQTPTPVTEADPRQGSSQYKENAPEVHSVCVKEEPAGLETVHIKDEPAGLETVQIKDERAGLETVHIVEEPAGLEAVQIKEEVPEFEPVNIKEEATELDSLHIIEVPEVNESDPGGPYEDQRQVEDDRTDKATQKQTKWAIKIFKDSCRLALDRSTAHRNLWISEADSKVTMRDKSQLYLELPARFNTVWQVLCTEGLFGARFYWEIEWSGTATIGVTYKGIGRKGWDDSCRLGRNDKSWSLCCSGSCYSAWHNKKLTEINAPLSPRIGVHLDCPAGVLSFYSISNTASLLHSFHCNFAEPLYPGFGFWDYDSCVTICQPQVL